MMPPTLRGVKCLNLLLITPSHPRSNPITCIPFECAMRVAALIAAFIPGASPPVVTTPMVLDCVNFSRTPESSGIFSKYSR